MLRLATVLVVVALGTSACRTTKPYRESGGREPQATDGANAYRDPGTQAKTKKAFQTFRY